jgi:hypothetical protein
MKCGNMWIRMKVKDDFVDIMLSACERLAA